MKALSKLAACQINARWVHGSPLRLCRACGLLGRGGEAVLAQVVKRLGGRIPVISAGGIMGPEDAKRRLDMGAALVQVYTGLIYRGPGLVRQIVRGLSSS